MSVGLLSLAAALSLVVGVVLGMLGGGGAILTLPMLVYVLGVEPKTAVAMSLFVVGATSAVGTVAHARAGNVRWKVGAMFGASAMAGAFAGARLAQLVPARAILVLFGVVMVTTATVLLARREDATGAERTLRLGRALGLGGAVGVLSGLVGAGGGFLIVPALTLFGGLAMREAIGTSLFVITLQAATGFAGHATNVDLDWPLVLAVTGAAVAGGLAGARLGSRVSARSLRRAFAWLVVAMGLFVFARELPPVPAFAAGATTLLAAWIATRRATSGPKQPRHAAAPPAAATHES
jgi:uncharacterized membrane protein YfcA